MLQGILKRVMVVYRKKWAAMGIDELPSPAFHILQLKLIRACTQDPDCAVDTGTAVFLQHHHTIIARPMTFSRYKHDAKIACATQNTNYQNVVLLIFKKKNDIKFC